MVLVSSSQWSLFSKLPLPQGLLPPPLGEVWNVKVSFHRLSPKAFPQLLFTLAE